MNNGFIRTYQAVMAVGKNFLSWRWPRVIMGEGSFNELPDTIKSDGYDRVLIVTGHTVAKQKFMAEFTDSLDAKGITYFRFSEVKPNPTVENVEDLKKMYEQNNCSAIVAVGGGSSMDCAKTAAARITNPSKSVEDLKGLLKLRKKISPLYAVPTTAGSGSETTIAALVTGSNHHKYTINDVKMLPAYAILDPRLLVGLGPRITAETGMDALTHAVEAYTNKFTTKEVRSNALKAVQLIMANIEGACKNGADLKHRQAMQLGAYLAGTAFTKSGVGYVHATGHTLGGLYDVPHGRAMAVILPKVLRRYGDAVVRRLAELADAVGIEGGTSRAKADNFINRIEELNSILDIPSGFDCILESDIPQMCRWAVAEANPVYPCPQIWREEDICCVLEDIRLCVSPAF